MRSHACLGVALVAALATVIAAGCGTSPAAPASPTGAPPVPGPASTPSTTAHIGGGCGFIPIRGAGSFGTMRDQRTATAASGNPQLSVFSSALRAAALDGQLNRMRAFTLFIPVNSAFAALSKAQVEFLRNPVNLVKVVRRQVVPHPVTPAQIAHGVSVVTLSGSRLALAKQGQTYRVNRATVLCGNIKTANGTLYVIDRVLLPPK